MPAQSHTGALSRHLQQTLADLRADFVGYTEGFKQLAVRRAHLAPAFMRAFRRYRMETGRTFVAFVRELDPSMPVARSEYPRHRSFQAALYLRRLAEAPHTTPTHRRTETPFAVLARVVKTVLPLTHPHEEATFEAIARASGWRERDVQRLRDRVNRAKPLATVLAFARPASPRLVRHSTHRAPLAVAADRPTVPPPPEEFALPPVS